MQSATHDNKWFKVSLRFSGENLQVEGLESKINLKATTVGMLGGYIDNNPKYAKHLTNLWVWSSPEDSSVDFEQQLETLLDHLEQKKQDLAEVLLPDDVRGELFLGFSSSNGQGGAYFSPTTLSRVGALGLALNLDLYPPHQE